MKKLRRRFGTWVLEKRRRKGQKVEIFSRVETKVGLIRIAGSLLSLGSEWMADAY